MTFEMNQTFKGTEVSASVRVSWNEGHWWCKIESCSIKSYESYEKVGERLRARIMSREGSGSTLEEAFKDLRCNLDSTCE